MSTKRRHERLKKKKHVKRVTKSPSDLTPRDRQVIHHARTVKLYCFVNSENGRQPRYVFFDPISGRELSSCWRPAFWVSAINKALDKRRELLGQPSFNRC